MSKTEWFRFWVFAGLIISSIRVFSAPLKFAGVFTDDTILQREMPVRVWGTADSGERVVVTFADQEKKTVADSDGKWMATLDPMPASSEPRTLTIYSPLATCHLSNVLVGEVWLAGGQSNMQTTMGFYKKTTQSDMDNADDSMLRMITIKPGSPGWELTTPETVPGFSATAYYFAKNLRESVNVPVGIISCSVGGSPVEAWMSRATMESNPLLKKTLEVYDARGTTTLKPNHRPCDFYESKLTQTIPYTIRGVIWYQGERNANYPSGYTYRYAFSALIEGWRKVFKNPDLPFLFAQLATLGPSVTTPYWAELRESQSWVETHVPNTGMIVMADGGEKDNIHPHSKDKAGARFSLLARNLVYGESDLVCRGPRFEKAEKKDNSIALTFTDAGSGLVLRPAETSAFEICGSDGAYKPADAVLKEGKVMVSSPEVSSPQHVRYGWRQWFVPTLYNAEGLPASPFRTDDFEPVTLNRFYLDTL